MATSRNCTDSEPGPHPDQGPLEASGEGPGGHAADEPEPPIEFDSRGALFAHRYGDLYFQPGQDGLAESRHVFLAGNRLPERLAEPEDAPLCVGETGFGTGLNFLATWQARRDLERSGHRAPRPLTWISTELHPLPRALLAAALRPFAELEPLASKLLDVWPATAPSRPGPRWLEVAESGEAVRLCVLFGDAGEQLGRTPFRVDAWCLDGFAPSRNPALWSESLLAAVANHTRPGGTLATYTVAGAVRRGLAAVGFDLVRRPGFGNKREMLTGVRTSAGPDRRPCDARRPVLAQPPKQVRIAGAGLAGSWAARALAERGCQVTVYDPHPRAGGGGASAQSALVFQPRLGAADQPDARLVAQAFRFTVEALERIDPARSSWNPCGVVHLARDASEWQRLLGQLERACDLEPSSAEMITAADLRELAGVPLANVHGGLFLKTGGWLRPRALCARLLSHPNIDVQAGSASGLEDADGVRILADSHHVQARRGLAGLGLRPTRGQSSVISLGTIAPAVVLCRDGYLTPACAGRSVSGATYAAGDTDRAERATDDSVNRARFATELAGATEQAPLRRAETGIRATTPDRLPRVGAVPDLDRGPLPARDARADPPWRAGLYVDVGHGSRGSVTAPLAGETLAAELFGEPPPIAEELLQRLAPIRALRRSAAERS